MDVLINYWYVWSLLLMITAFLILWAPDGKSPIIEIHTDRAVTFIGMMGGDAVPSENVTMSDSSVDVSGLLLEPDKFISLNASLTGERLKKVVIPLEDKTITITECSVLFSTCYSAVSGMNYYNMHVEGSIKLNP